MYCFPYAQPCYYIPTCNQRATIGYPVLETKTTDSFRNSISNLIHYAEMTPHRSYTMTDLCTQFKFQRRRLYDVVNVFVVLGLCQKTSVDTIVWLGRDNIQSTVTPLNENFTEDDLASFHETDHVIQISNLTKSFALCFLVLKNNTLDIKRCAEILSKRNNRFKTTLCKLYQIAHILEAAGIFSKSTLPGEITFKSEFIGSLKQDKIAMALSIKSLLNHNVCDDIKMFAPSPPPISDPKIPACFVSSCYV